MKVSRDLSLQDYHLAMNQPPKLEARTVHNPKEGRMPTTLNRQRTLDLSRL